MTSAQRIENEAEQQIAGIAKAMLSAGVSEPVAMSALSSAAREMLVQFSADRRVRVVPRTLDLRAGFIARKALATQALCILRG